MSHQRAMCQSVPLRLPLTLTVKGSVCLTWTRLLKWLSLIIHIPAGTWVGAHSLSGESLSSECWHHCRSSVQIGGTRWTLDQSSIGSWLPAERWQQAIYLFSTFSKVSVICLAGSLSLSTVVLHVLFDCVDQIYPWKPCCNTLPSVSSDSWTEDGPLLPSK